MGFLDYMSNIRTVMLDRYFSYRPGYTVNPLYNDTHYNSKIRYNVNLVCTKISGSSIFSLIFPSYSSGKYTFSVFVRIASARRF